MAQEILLKSGERVNRYDYMEQMKNIEKMKEDAKKKQPTQDAAPEKIEGKEPISDKLTVPQLKAIATGKGLEVEGLRKAELLELLLESEDEDETGL